MEKGDGDVEGDAVNLNQFLWVLFSMLVISPMAGFMMFVRKRDKETLDKLTTDVAVLQSKQLTEQEVKTIIHDHLEPIKEGQTEIKQTVNTISALLTEMRLAMAARRGQSDLNDS